MYYFFDYILYIDNDIFYLGNVDQKVQSYDENIGIVKKLNEDVYQLSKKGSIHIQGNVLICVQFI